MTLTDLTDEISPFPDAGNVLFTANRSSSPLRKLRPIRGTGDSPTKGSSSPIAAATSSSSSSMENDKDANPRMGPLWEIVARKLEQLEENQNTISDPVEIANMLVAMHSNSTSFPRFHQHHDDDDAAPDDVDAEASNSNKCKRKRRGFTKLELVLLNLMDKVMKKQEEMHKQLIDIIDKHDKDRIAREEAWRLQELERQERDKEMRQQHGARTLALINFIENLLGKPIHVPQVEPQQLDPIAIANANGNGNGNGKRTRKISEINEQCNQPQDLDAKFQPQDFTSKRWPEPEVKALIRYRTALDSKFKSLDVKHNIWEEVSNAMASAGYIRDAKKCKEKWENINKYFKKTVASGKRPKGTKTCPYFDELDSLYRSGFLGSPLAIEFKVEAETSEQRQ